MNKFGWIWLLVLSLPLGGCGDFFSRHTVKVAEKDSGTTVTLQKGQNLVVSLEGNGSTGYCWKVLPGMESILPQSGDSETVPDRYVTGAGETDKFTFKAVAPGTGVLKMIYYRPWETWIKHSPAFQITVIVQDTPNAKKPD